MKRRPPSPDEADTWIEDGPPPLQELQDRLDGIHRCPTGRGFIEAFAARETWVRNVTYGMPCLEVVEALTVRPLLEIAAGTGFWSALIAAAGGDVVATDIVPNGTVNRFGQPVGRYHPVTRMNAARAIAAHPGRDVLLVWPSYAERWPAIALLRMAPGRTLHLVGEGPGGATGDDWMHYVAEQRFTAHTWTAVPTWRGIHDHLTTMTRRDA